MPDVGGLQLLPETRKKIEIRVPGQNKFVVLGFIFILIIFGIYFALYLYQTSINTSLATLDSQLAAIEKARDKTREAKLLELNQQLSIINPLLGNHLIWSDAFTRIQKISLPQVQYKFLNTDIGSKKFLFTAQAPNYTTVAKQIASFYSDDAITDVNLNKVTSLPTGRVEFSLRLFFDQNKFLLKPVSPTK